ncbi:MAG: terpene cyclase/mutase family protein [Planctomycetes bacterium]|nr:terpene cyclase/mutase family protein [Planctomycetota bacterium]
MKKYQLLLLGLLLLCVFAGPSSRNVSAEVSQKEIDKTIKKGMKFLMKKRIKGREAELMALTFAHLGLSEKHSKIRDSVNYLLKSKLKETYNVSVMAMALEAINRKKYQIRIAECAQALVNYQCKDGRWHYPAHYRKGKDTKQKRINEAPEMREVVSGGGDRKRKDDKPTKKIVIKRAPKDDVPNEGHMSTSQFALLGLRSAARSGVEIPEETWAAALKIIQSDQLADGGWCYVAPGQSYASGSRNPRASYGGMTCAGLCALAIALGYNGKEMEKDPGVQRGLKWIANNFTVEKNPGPIFTVPGINNRGFFYYYLYGIERVGAILGKEKIGSNDWYQAGAEYLVENQGKDGSWFEPSDAMHSTKIADTCFALLFLRRATPKLRMIQTD